MNEVPLDVTSPTSIFPFAPPAVDKIHHKITFKVYLRFCFNSRPIAGAVSRYFKFFEKYNARL